MTIEDLVGERGPMTVAAFMDLALYHPELGYYARASQRSGRSGDFFTSVDVGPAFGALLAEQIGEMFDVLSASTAPSAPSASFDLVEAGAGNGRLAADILRALRRRNPARHDLVGLHLVEASAEARRAQRDALGELAGSLVSSSESLPPSFEGVLIANELLDAFPVHQIVMREDGLREIYVINSRQSTADWRLSTADCRLSTADCRLSTVEGPLSTPALADYLAARGISLEPGWRAEVNLRAIDWIRQIAKRLRRGFIILIDYGHDARELYSASHATGTLTTFSRHRGGGRDTSPPAWLEHPGEHDLTAHVDFTSVRAAAEEEGLQTLGFMDQTYFLLGLIAGSANEDLSADATTLHDRLAWKTLLMPGGLGSTHKVLILGKDVGTPTLRGCSFRPRVT